MPHHGKQHSILQRQHTQEMRGQGLMQKSPPAAKITKPVDPRAASKQRKKDVKEINIQRRQIHTTQKREARLKEKINNQVKVMNSLRKFSVETQG